MDLINTNNESESQRQPWLEFRNLGAERKVKTKLTMMDFVSTDFSIFRDLLKKVSGDEALEGRRAQEICFILKDLFIQVKEGSMPSNVWNKADKNVWSPAWMNKLFPNKLKDKKEANKGWNQTSPDLQRSLPTSTTLCFYICYTAIQLEAKHIFQDV